MENAVQLHWYDKTWLVILLCIFFFPVGLYGLWKNSSITKGWKIGVTVLIAILVIAQIGKKNEDGPGTNSHTSGTPADKSTPAEQAGVSVGQVLHTTYFDVTVNQVGIENKVNTGNEFANLPPEPGNRYLIMNTSFKNTDNESRMIIEGSVWINYNGQNYEFDNPETIMLEGWGVFLDQINPLTTKTTNLVYKIPTEIQGPAYWQPGRSEDDQKIFLGNIK